MSTTKSKRLIASYLNKVHLYAASQGIIIELPTENYFDSQEFAEKRSTLPPIFDLLTPLVTRNDVNVEGNKITLNASVLKVLEVEYDNPFASVFPSLNIGLKIDSKGAFGLPAFRFTFTLTNTSLNNIERVGPFLFQNEICSYISCVKWRALELIEEFNSSNDEERRNNVLPKIVELRELAQKDNIELSKYLNEPNIILADKIKLSAKDTALGFEISPQFEGLSEENSKVLVDRLQKVQNVYQSISESGKREYIVPTSEVKSALNSIKKKGKRLSPEDKERVIRNPLELFAEDVDDGKVLDAINLDGWHEKHAKGIPKHVSIIVYPDNNFGPRVKGIDYGPQKGLNYNSSTEMPWFPKSDLDTESSSSSGKVKPKAKLVIDDIDGQQREVILENDDDINELKAKVKEAVNQKHQEIIFKGIKIPVNESLEQVIDSIASELERTSSTKPTFDIERNEEELGYEDKIQTKLSVTFKKPKCLLATLKPHQNEGITWLLSRLQDGTPGVILADDMGLGKTLQTLAFAAACLESNAIPEFSTKIPPFQPMLILCPPILFENWEQEIQKYFAETIFAPILRLHGKELKRFKTGDFNPDKPLEPTLDLNKIKSNRVVITNYETLANHQISLGQIQWSIIVFDEAQQIKEPKTASSIAAKALKARFKIISTGTPVETNLVNLWNLFDTVYPGTVLGTLKEFNSKYNVRPNCTEDEMKEKSNKLKSSLGYYDKSRNLILRRLKHDRLDDFPNKINLTSFCELSALQQELYDQIVTEVSNEPKGKTLSGLIKLQQLSEHPFLLMPDKCNTNDISILINVCPKLEALLKILEQIHIKKEKALIFTRFLNMQSILKRVLQNKFGITADIINGDTANRGYGKQNITSKLSEFSEKDGFNALILSPDTAGVGLNITAANHVIHYGRWWNPAKENQATDRAYRIGQKKDVFVHYIISRRSNDPDTQTFDELLDGLISKRIQLANDFLAPIGNEDLLKEDLNSEIFGGKNTSENTEARQNDAIITTSSDLRSLTHIQFESLIALLFREVGTVFLTPEKNDRGIDVLVYSQKEVAFIQCKHTRTNQEENYPNAINELIEGFEFYEKEILGFMPASSKLIWATNKKVNSTLQRKALEKEVIIYGETEILRELKNKKVYLRDILSQEKLRVRSLNDIVDYFNSLNAVKQKA